MASDAWAEIGKYAGGGSVGALALGIGTWVLRLRASLRLDRASEVDADERERRLALDERQQTVSEYRELVAGLQADNASLRSECGRLRARLTSVGEDPDA